MKKSMMAMSAVWMLLLAGCGDKPAISPVNKGITLNLNGGPLVENPIAKVDVTASTVGQLKRELETTDVKWESAGLLCLNYRKNLPQDGVTNLVAFDVVGAGAVTVLGRDPETTLDAVCQERAAAV